MNGIGAHEVIVETPDHQVEFHQHSYAQMEEVIRMWRDRHLDLRRDPRLKYILIFKNEGHDAGASLEHSHSQVMAVPMLPKSVEEEIELGLKRYLNQTNHCIFCDMIQQEISEQSRVVLASPRFLAFCPFASRFPFETWIIPRNHEPDFGLLKEEEVKELARVLKNTLGELSEVLNSPPYNLLLHSTPVNIDIGVSYHWHIEILPRLTKAAGFEYGTDYFINPTPPEMAAESLKTALSAYTQ
jgi:UDPglucose--hexose-1-phosphate uridylyltransferase